jgi:hypothetical protein
MQQIRSMPITCATNRWPIDRRQGLKLICAVGYAMTKYWMTHSRMIDMVFCSASITKELHADLPRNCMQIHLFDQIGKHVLRLLVYQLLQKI